MNRIIELQRATQAARARLDDRTIGTRVKNGMFQIVAVQYDDSGRSSVKPLTKWQTADQCIDKLNRMGND